MAETPSSARVCVALTRLHSCCAQAMCSAWVLCLPRTGRSWVCPIPRPLGDCRDQTPRCQRGERIRRGRDVGVRGQAGRLLPAWIPLSGGASSMCSGTWLSSLRRDHHSQEPPRHTGMGPGAASGLLEQVLWAITGPSWCEGSCHLLLPHPCSFFRHHQAFTPSRGDLQPRSLPLSIANSLQHLSRLHAVWGADPPPSTTRSC